MWRLCCGSFELVVLQCLSAGREPLLTYCRWLHDWKKCPWAVEYPSACCRASVPWSTQVHGTLFVMCRARVERPMA